MSQTDSFSDDVPATADNQYSFDDSETRSTEMQESLEQWVEDLASMTDDAQASEEFRGWLDVQSRFHDYSHRNTLLIKHQCPEETRVAGYRTWQSEFDRHLKKGESAIWIWAPIITNRCPECETSPSYHEQSGCDYDETPPEEWSEGLVGFRPTSVFDISQTEGEPLPELDTAAYGDADGLVEALVDAGERLGFEVRIVKPEDWEHGEARGVCIQRSPMTLKPLIEAQDRDNEVDLARTLIHEYAQAILHFKPDDDEHEAKLEVGAEAVAYVVCRHFGLEVDKTSTFYLAAWDDEAPETLHERLGRIASPAEELIDAVDYSSN